MSDEYLLRDEKGDPLTSIFHKPPIKTWVPKSMREYPEKAFGDQLKKLFDNLFHPITEFHPDDMKGDEEE